MAGPLAKMFDAEVCPGKWSSRKEKEMLTKGVVTVLRGHTAEENEAAMISALALPRIGTMDKVQEALKVSLALDALNIKVRLGQQDDAARQELTELSMRLCMVDSDQITSRGFMQDALVGN
jgi:hypothetical protein